MSSIPTLEGVASDLVQTARLKVHVLSTAPHEGAPVLFIHGNGSSAAFWEETMLALPEGFWALAPDMRGYGDSERLPVDATLGLELAYFLLSSKSHMIKGGSLRHRPQVALGSMAQSGEQAHQPGAPRCVSP